MSSEEWEDRVQSDVTTSTYSTSSDSELTENEMNGNFSEASLSSKGMDMNSGALPPEGLDSKGSSQHVINLLQPVCITLYHIVVTIATVSLFYSKILISIMHFHHKSTSICKLSF